LRRIALHCIRPSCATRSSQVKSSQVDCLQHTPKQYHITSAAKSRRKRPQPTGTTHLHKDIFASNPVWRLVFRPADPISFAQLLEALLRTFIHFFSPPHVRRASQPTLALVLQSTHSTFFIQRHTSLSLSLFHSFFIPFPFPSCRAADFTSPIAISKRSSSGFGKSTGTNLKSSLGACDNKKERRTPRAQSIYPSVHGFLRFAVAQRLDCLYTPIDLSLTILFSPEFFAGALLVRGLIRHPSHLDFPSVTTDDDNSPCRTGERLNILGDRNTPKRSPAIDSTSNIYTSGPDLLQLRGAAFSPTTLQDTDLNLRYSTKNDFSFPHSILPELLVP
jgi:hypothetical protein